MEGQTIENPTTGDHADGNHQAEPRATTTVIDLSYAKTQGKYLTDLLVERVRQTAESGGTALLYLNKRGHSRSFVCQDCSHRFTCPLCDISLAYHVTPKKRLVCHRCGKTEGVPERCPKCDSSHLVGIGGSIQETETHLRAIFPHVPVYRVDSDARKEVWFGIGTEANTSGSTDSEDESGNVETTSETNRKSSPKSIGRIILATELVNAFDLGQVDLVAFLFLEAEFHAPRYDVEERVYDNVAYNIRRGKEVIIQTYLPKSPIVRIIADGNFREFFLHTLEERKAFGYPPYSEMVRIDIRHTNKDRVNDTASKLANKLLWAQEGFPHRIAVRFDPGYFERIGGEWKRSIEVQGENVRDFLRVAEREILLNPELRVEWYR